MSLTSNADARLYYMVACQRFEDAEVLLYNSTRPRTNAGIYLAGFAVECILKSLILANTTARQRAKILNELKTKYAHDLDSLRKEAARRGKHMQQEVIEAFRRVNTWNNNARYSPGVQSVEDAVSLLDAARIVMRWARRAEGDSDE